MIDDLLPPPDDSDETWHVHDMDRTWGWGIDCDDCRGTKDGSRFAHTAPMLNIRHLKRQNQDGTTTASEEREALGDRWDDPKIGRVS